MGRILLLLVLCCPSTILFGQSLFSNDIQTLSPNDYNPYTIGQIVHPDITVSGISRGSGITAINANNRYDAVNWHSSTLDLADYFEFVLTPNAGKEINFIEFKYTSQVSENGPTDFTLRSSVDGFTSNIGLISQNGGTVLLSDPSFQNRTTATSFRIYGWGAILGVGAFSINDFAFKGIVNCADPEAVVLPTISVACRDTSFNVNWTPSLHAVGYTVDIATDSEFNSFVDSYNKKDIGNSTTTNVEGLIAGATYYMRVHAVNECESSVVSNTVMVSPPVTVYNGGLWSNGDPDATKKIQFLNNYTVTTDLSACSCRIDAGVSVSVVGESMVTLENGLEVLGSLTFENNSSLVQVNDAAVNTGTITYKRISTPMNNFDFTYWSSPVAGQSLFNVSPNTFYDKYWSFSSNKWVSENSANIMSAGKGYAIRTPKGGQWPNGENVNFPYKQEVAFIGALNNGRIELEIEPTESYNLIGNPYPSALSASAFLEENLVKNSILNGTLYFWTHSTPIANNAYGGTSDYAVYNGTGSIGVNGGPQPDGNIAAGQSFFVMSKGTGKGPVVFTNSMRVTEVQKNSKFYKGIKSTKATTESEKSRVWMGLTNPDGLSKQLLLGYLNGATNGLDVAYDGESFNNNANIDFYSINDGLNFSIQGRAMPFLKTDEVPLGYKTTLEGTFEIKITQQDGLFVNQALYLKDKTTGKIHNLKKQPYSFFTLKGTFNDRFVLVYVDKTAIAEPLVEVTPPLTDIPVVLLDNSITNGDFDGKSKDVLVSVKNHQIKVNSFDEIINSVMVYDLKGRALYKNDNLITHEHSIVTLSEKKQLLIVAVKLKNGVKKYKKIIY